MGEITSGVMGVMMGDMMGDMTGGMMSGMTGIVMKVEKEKLETLYLK